MENKGLTSETITKKIKYRTKRYGKWVPKEIQLSKTIDPESIWMECRRQVMKELEVDYVEIQMN